MKASSDYRSTDVRTNLMTSVSHPHHHHKHVCQCYYRYTLTIPTTMVAKAFVKAIHTSYMYLFFITTGASQLIIFWNFYRLRPFNISKRLCARVVAFLTTGVSRTFTKTLDILHCHFIIKVIARGIITQGACHDERVDS